MSASAPAPAPCLLGAPRGVIPIDDPKPGELHEVHDVPDTPALWAPAPPDPERSRFRDAVAARLGGRIDPQSLLQRQRPFYETLPELRGEADNATAVLEGRAGRIGPISCLEAMLWRRQAARWAMIEHPTELGAFVLRGNGVVRVFFSSSDLVGQKIRGPVTERVGADVAAGLVLVAHLHNHPFLFDRVVGDRMWTTEATKGDVAGALAPSKTDVQLWRRLRDAAGLRAGWVTNGLDTARFDAADFDRLVAAE